MADIYLNIKEIAERKNIQQKDLAVQLNVSEKTMVNYFHGRTAIKADQLELFARALRVSISAFFGNKWDTAQEPPASYCLAEHEKLKDTVIELQEDKIKRLEGEVAFLKQKYETLLATRTGT